MCSFSDANMHAAFELLIGLSTENIPALRTVSTVGEDAEAAIALVPNPIASTVLPSKVVKVARRV